MTFAVKMDPILPSLSVIVGALMIASKCRVRFPCFVGGTAAILAGGFILALPVLDSIQPIGWVWFCVWIASLPILIACAISLAILALSEKKLLIVASLCGIAVLSNITPTLEFAAAARL